jgi:hypothetical protein
MSQNRPSVRPTFVSNRLQPLHQIGTRPVRQLVPWRRAAINLQMIALKRLSHNRIGLAIAH